jgi:translation initiation factor 2B subunit (eIF-2B alpha/beta/delta family)
VEALVVDVFGEGSGLVRRLLGAEVDAVDVPAQGIGAAATAADVVVLEASAIGPDAALAVAGSRAAAAVARHAEVPVWLVGGVGRLLPRRLWEVVESRAVTTTDDPWDADDEVVPLDLVDRLVGPHGPEPVADGIRRTDCPIAPELLKEL